MTSGRPTIVLTVAIFLSFKYEKLLTPPAESIDERSKAFFILLRGEIKKKLRPGRRDDPDVRTEVPIDRDVFFVYFSKLGVGKGTERRNYGVIRKSSYMEKYLG